MGEIKVFAHKYATNLSKIKKNASKMINLWENVLLFAEKVVYLQTKITNERIFLYAVCAHKCIINQIISE